MPLTPKKKTKVIGKDCPTCACSFVNNLSGQVCYVAFPIISKKCHKLEDGSRSEWRAVKKDKQPQKLQGMRTSINFGDEVDIPIGRFHQGGVVKEAIQLPKIHVKMQNPKEIADAIRKNEPTILRIIKKNLDAAISESNCMNKFSNAELFGRINKQIPRKEKKMFKQIGHILHMLGSGWLLYGLIFKLIIPFVRHVVIPFIVFVNPFVVQVFMKSPFCRHPNSDFYTDENTKMAWALAIVTIIVSILVVYIIHKATKWYWGTRK